ncbi:hypothetical protein U1Q18_028355 [Sarracenia purpurea var. burkii]
MATKLSLAIIITLLAALHQTTAAQTVHVVGDGLGWLVPPGGPIAYSTWADTQTFAVGDTLGTIARHCPLGQKLAINVTGGAPGPAPSSPPSTPSAPVPASERAPVSYAVGDGLGWFVPPGGELFYAAWAANKTFVLGDTLVFNFENGTQNVAVVTKAVYDSCDTNSTIALLTTSPATIALTTTGDHYFTSTYARHCGLGQKLTVSVIGDGSSGPTASPAPIPPPPPPSAPVPTPPRAPITYVVGDRLGWLVPPGGAIAYSTWAYDKTFIVGDTLVFNFPNGTQDVAVVSQAAFVSCDTNTNATVYTVSPVEITLTTPGKHYYTSTYRRHCNLGQQLAIDVIAASGTATSLTPSSTSPESPPSTTTTTTTTTTTESLASASTAGGPIPPPTSSAPSYTVAGFFCVTLLSIATAVLF